MRTNFIKFYFHQLVFVFFVIVVSFSCKDDTIINEEVIIKKEFTIKTIHKQELYANKKISNVISKYDRTNKSFTDSITGIEIDTDNIKYIELLDGYHSYTFSVINTTAKDVLENILLSLQSDGTYKEYLVKYNLTASEVDLIKEGIEVSIENKFTIT